MALSAASVVNRLRLVETLFSIFDLDTDGKITKEEMGKMLHTLVDVTNSNKKRRNHHRHHYHSNGYINDKETNLQKRIDDAFNELNTNADDHITKDEFIEWYIKSGLLSDKSNEINVTDRSRLHRLDKKSRKMKKQQLNASNNNKKEENQHVPLARHMSHMTEQRPSAINLDDDEDEDEINDNNQLENCTRINSDDNDSHYSKENERWQYLFNSVLGQIRAQRSQEDEQQEEINLDTHNRISHFNSWKQQGEEKIKKEYYKQKSIDQPSDVVTIRL